MTETYWKSRCEAAEDALRRARSRIWISPVRSRILALLADQKQGRWMTTAEVTQCLGLMYPNAVDSLRKLYEAGLVDRSAGHGSFGHPVSWRLGYMVVVGTEAQE